MERNTKLISLYVVELFIGIQVGISPIIPLFFESVGISVNVWGKLAAVSALGMLIFEPFWGWLSDRFGRTIFIVGSLLVGALLTSMYSYTIHVLLFFLLQFFRGVFIVMAAPASRALVSDLSPPSNLGMAMGLLWASLRLGGAVGVIFASYLAENWTFAISFYSCSFLLFGGGILGVLLLKYLKPSESEDTARPEVRTVSYVENLKGLPQKGTVLILLVCAVATLLQTRLITDFIPIYTLQFLGTSTFENGIIQATFTGASVLLFPISGAISDRADRKSARQILPIGFSVCCSASLFYIFAQNIYQLLLFTAGISIGLSILAPSILAFLSNIVPKETYGAIMGLYGGFENLGGIIAPLIYATAWHSFAPHSIFYVSSLSQVLGVVLTLTLKRIKR